MRSTITWLALAAGLLWLSYTLHGFRPPWQPLVESDGDAGGAIRQVLFVGCAGLAWYALLLQGKWALLLRVRFSWVLLGLLLGASVLYAERPMLTAKRTVVFACGLIVLLALVHLPRDPVRFLTWGMVATVGGLAWVSLLMWGGMPVDCWQTPSRPGLAGVTGHPNTIGPALAIAWVLSLGVSQTSIRARFMLRLLQLGLVVALVLTDSIGSFGVAAVGAGIFVLLTAGTYWRATMVLGAVCCLPMVILESGALSGWLLESLGRDASLSGRDVLWSEIGREFFSRPILGAGFGSFWYEGRGREIVGTWNPRQSHNAYLDLSLDLGLLGALFVCGLLVACLWRGWQRHAVARDESQRRTYASMFSVPLALLLVGAFSESYLLKMDKFQFFAMTWVILTLDASQFAPPPRFALQIARA